MKDFQIRPFANESEALTLGDLNIENHVDKVSIFGSIDITKDMKAQPAILAIILLDILSPKIQYVSKEVESVTSALAELVGEDEKFMKEK